MAENNGVGHIDTVMGNGDDQNPRSAQGYGSGDSNQSRSPLHGFSIFKGVNAEKKTKADGQQPKRRGPKPDSKPALTRRQELNRQAQRTHRERKEMYIKALEHEVLNLKEMITEAARDRDAFRDENRQLKDLLARHGIPYSGISTPTDRGSGNGANGSSGANSSGGPGNVSSASYPQSFPNSNPDSQSPPNQTNGGAREMSGTVNVQPHMDANGDSDPAHTAHQLTPPGTSHAADGSNEDSDTVDFEQTGIDFVLALERPCMDHMQMLCVKSTESDAFISGHALMATCPPANHIEDRPTQPYPHKMPDIPKSDLIKLLELSSQLPLEGEITPVMAWAYLARDERFSSLTKEHFEIVRDDLLAKVRCYGFGAVLEEFEVKDALEGALQATMDLNQTQPLIAAQA